MCVTSKTSENMKKQAVEQGLFYKLLPKKQLMPLSG